MAAPDPLAVRLTGYIPHKPHPPQHAFLWLNCKEALYGGAAGGGKSDAMLMAALQYVDVPGYAAILFRRTFADLRLPGALMARSHEWLAETDARWDGVEHAWRFPSGATLAFGYLDSERDKYRYQSAEFQFVGFDELTQFRQEDYEYLFSRLRKPSEGPLSRVPLRMRAASNPGGSGHRWVKERFRPGQPAETPDRVFIPAKLPDNPSVDQAAYESQLAELDPQTRAQLRDGDWDAREPGLWVYDSHGIEAAARLGDQYDLMRTAGALPPPASYSIQLGIDWGIGTTHALLVWQLAGGGLYLPPGELVSHRGEPGDLTRRMLEHAAAYEHPLDEARYDSAGAQQMATFAAIAPEQVGIYAVNFSKRKDRTIGYLRELFHRTGEGKATRVIAISPTNTVLIDQLRGLKQTEDGKVVKGDDHGPDALIAAAAPVAAAFPDTLTAVGTHS